MEQGFWNIYIDTGGTFTDCMAQAPDGATQRFKVLSSGKLRGRLLKQLSPTTFRIEQHWPGQRPIFQQYRFALADGRKENAKVISLDLNTGYLILDQEIPFEPSAIFELSAEEEAPVLACRLATGTALQAPFPPIQLRLGTTKATNALLEQKGAKTGLLTTKGFRDLHLIGTQQRPNLFQLSIPPPFPLVELALEIEERLEANGTVLQPLNLQHLPAIKRELQQKEIEAVAVVLLHAYKNPIHEQKIAHFLKEAGFDHVSISHELSSAIGLVPRLQTTLINAYLAPVLNAYLKNIRTALFSNANPIHFQIMNSAGGLVEHPAFQPKDSLLSGPAGGVVGAARIGAALGVKKILTFDMGGTSTDTSRIDGGFDYEFETRIDQFHLQAPALAIETVAAGGGSICSFDGMRLIVGPESAGAHPGPACYGAGGPLTITDVNLLLGRLDPALMGIPIHLPAAQNALAALQTAITQKTGEKISSLALLHGYLRIANEKMAGAINKISVAKGFDPADYALLAFGGAGGMHACELAAILNIQQVILPFDAGLLSAFGIGKAKMERIAQRQILQSLAICQEKLPAWIQELIDEASQALQSIGIPAEEVELDQTFMYLRLQGQDHTLGISFEGIEKISGTFERDYRKLFGHFPAKAIIEVESLKVRVVQRSSARAEELDTKGAGDYEAPIRQLMTMEGMEHPVYDWARLPIGTELRGPLVLINENASAFVPEGWALELQAGQNAVVRQTTRTTHRPKSLKQPIELELFLNRFRAIADEMGAQLRRTAFSVNIKERLDFSCALLDPQAQLLVNAPHIPVHLGSLGPCARAMLQALPLGPGDVLITNHPGYGGSHLPDVTLLTGAFTEKGELIGYLINRAHHAEIGGQRPGSMPPDARNLEQEGVVIPPMYLAKNGQVLWEEIESVLIGSPYPTRSLHENLADLEAALASLRRGQQQLQQLVQMYGLQKVHQNMQAVKALARSALHHALQQQTARSFHAIEALDDGHQIVVKGAIHSDGIHFDFSGSSGTHPGNLNANRAIVYSALLYVLRLLCKEPIPLNEGLMELVTLELPIGFLDPDFSGTPAACPAVVGGNTEVSQRLVDTLLKALELAACSQGTMNNFLFGNEHFGYYETIGGGAGATAQQAGRSAVHQHMTNTKITDPEILEWRYPVRLQRFCIRSGSGGQGMHPGGDGIVRELEFLEPVEVTLISQHRLTAPYGLAGGQPGQPGQQWLIKMDGTKIALKGISAIKAQAGDRIQIETPGGGGYAPPHPNPNPHPNSHSNSHSNSSHPYNS